MAINVRPAAYPAAGATAPQGIAAGIWAGIRGFFQKYWKQITMVALAGLLVAGIITAIIGSRKKRPENKKAKLSIRSFTWNHKGDPSNGSIHFHDSSQDPESPASMVFEPGSSRIDVTGVFVPSKRLSVTVDLVVRNTGTTEYSGYILLKDSSGVQIAKSSCIKVKKSLEATAKLTISAAQISKSGYEKKTGRYDICCTGGDTDTFFDKMRVHLLYVTGRADPAVE